MITKKQYDEAIKTVNLYVRQLESMSNNAKGYTAETKLSEVSMSKRLNNSLEVIAVNIVGYDNRHNFGEVTLSQIANERKKDFYMLRNFGHKSMAELEGILLNAGLKFNY
jgi:hypothetical protein